MLAVYAAQQRGYLLVCIVVQRMVKVQRVQRRNYLLRQPVRHDRRQHKRRQHYYYHRPQHAQCQRCNGSPAYGYSYYAAVVKPLCVVHRLLHKRCRIARALPFSGFKRLPHLLARGVVVQRAFVASAVVFHRAVGRYPCQPVSFAVHAGKVFLPALLNARRRKAQLILQLVFLQACKVFV